MLREDDELLKRLERYFSDQQADLVLFHATLNVTLMRREDILAELDATLLKAQALALRDRPLAGLPAVQDAADVPISPTDTPGLGRGIDLSTPHPRRLRGYRRNGA
jgi:hypothetical protein